MTVRELINALEEYGDDLKVVVTGGPISERPIFAVDTTSSADDGMLVVEIELVWDD